MEIKYVIFVIFVFFLFSLFFKIKKRFSKIVNKRAIAFFLKSKKKSKNISFWIKMSLIICW